jgi:hypothetical protein
VLVFFMNVGGGMRRSHVCMRAHWIK